MIAYLINCAMSCFSSSSSSNKGGNSGLNGGFGGSWVNSDGQVTSTSGTFNNASAQEVLGMIFVLFQIVYMTLAAIPLEVFKGRGRWRGGGQTYTLIF